MPKDNDGYKEGVDFKWVTNPNTNVKTRKFFTKAEKAEMAAGKKADAPTATSTRGPKPKARPAAKPKKDVVTSAREAIERSGPTRPKSRPSSGNTRPKARPSSSATSDSIAAPEVTESKLPARSGGGSSEGKNRFQMSPMERLRGFFGSIPKGGLSERDRKPRGMAKGGMVKANCGASMKPTQKSSKGK
jgi:hypothetical protein